MYISQVSHTKRPLVHSLSSVSVRGDDSLYLESIAEMLSPSASSANGAEAVDVPAFAIVEMVDNRSSLVAAGASVEGRRSDGSDAIVEGRGVSADSMVVGGGEFGSGGGVDVGVRGGVESIPSSRAGV